MRTCDIKHQHFPILNIVAGQIRIRQQAVDLQKHQTGGKRRPFVAIDKGMIATQIKKIGSGDFLRIADQWHPAGGRLWCSNGGFEQRTITQSSSAAMRAQHLSVYGEDRRDIQMNQQLLRQDA